MKITFLGTGQAAPAPDRFCTATLLETAGRAYLIDAGAPVSDLLARRGVGLEQLRAVFTTHSHLDHTIGLPHLCVLASWHCPQAEFSVYFTDPEYLAACRTLIRTARDALDEGRVRFCLVAPGDFYDDGYLQLQAIPTRHLEAQGKASYAYLARAEGKRLLFTGDLHNKDAADFPAEAAAQPTDLILCELSHFGPEAILPRLAGCPAKQVLFHHLGSPQQPILQALAQAAGRFPFPLRAVEDGETLEL